MDGDLADLEGIVGNATGSLIGEVVLARCPQIGHAGGGIQLACAEKLHFSVLEAAKG